MKKRRKIISQVRKAKILAESNIPGSVISLVAAKYNISPHLLYSWRSADKKLDQNKLPITDLPDKCNFVELSTDKIVMQNLILKKASLEFDNFSFIIEGNVESKKLMKIITLLEEAC